MEIEILANDKGSAVSYNTYDKTLHISIESTSGEYFTEHGEFTDDEARELYNVLHTLYGKKNDEEKERN